MTSVPVVAVDTGAGAAARASGATSGAVVSGRLVASGIEPGSNDGPAGDHPTRWALPHGLVVSVSIAGQTIVTTPVASANWNCIVPGFATAPG